MNKIVSLALSGVCTLISAAAAAQTYADEALIFSRTNPGGSARIQAMGGSQVALGGDYSSAFSNPAGLGFFNRSEATFSMGTNFFNSTTSYLGNNTSDSKSNFNIPGFSLVLHNDKNTGKLISGNFALSFTRTNNFNQNFTYQTPPGQNAPNSLIDYFIEQSNGADPSQFDTNGYSFYTLARLGFSNFLFGPNSDGIMNGSDSVYGSYINPRTPAQTESVQVTGAQNQFNVAYGLNFGDQFYLGAGVGFPSFNYRSNKTFTETFTGQPISDYILNETYNIKGSGINATLGAIFRPKDFVQFGLSVATPTYYYSVADNYSATLTSTWKNYTYVDVTRGVSYQLGHESDNMDQIIANYTLTTPWRIKAGATFFIQKRGLITAEIEKINYSKSSLSSQTDGLDFTYDNSDIKTLYANVFNIRGGGEYRFGNFRARLGYSFMPDPYVAIQNKTDNTITSFSGGFGYRTAKFFADLGIIQTNWNSSYNPYTINSIDSPVVTLKNASTALMVTLGFNL